MIVISKDSLGGYWLSATTNARHWSRIEHAISQATLTIIGASLVHVTGETKAR